MGSYCEVPGKAADTMGTAAAPGCTKLEQQTSGYRAEPEADAMFEGTPDSQEATQSRLAGGHWPLLLMVAVGLFQLSAVDRNNLLTGQRLTKVITA